MGQDKRFLDVGGEDLLTRVLNVYRELFEEVIIVVADSSRGLTAGQARVLCDLIPNGGSLGGLYTGLSASNTPWIFSAACDMPFLNPDVIESLGPVDEDMDVVIPRVLKRLEPMHAFYSRRCLPYFYMQLRDGRFPIHQALTTPALRLKVIDEDKLRLVDPQLLTFLNVNTPADLAFARKSLVPPDHASEP